MPRTHPTIEGAYFDVVSRDTISKGAILERLMGKG